MYRGQGITVLESLCVDKREESAGEGWLLECIRKASSLLYRLHGYLLMTYCRRSLQVRSVIQVRSEMKEVKFGSLYATEK